MSRLAVATADALVLIDGPTLKKAPSTVPSACNFLSQPTASAWAVDNNCLFLSLADAIEKYDPSGTHLDTVYPTSDPATALVNKDKGKTLIFSANNEITVLETNSRKVANKFNTHRHTIIGLALSNDASLLASISSNAVHVHNLSLASHVILRGFPSGTITACAFHPHTRTRLLLGVGPHLAVYDATRTSGPVKTFTLEKAAGDIVAISCSPYSKTLAAVACNGGSVSLIDLEKEKGVFRTVSLHVPPTSLVFSPEGAALYVGTENGKVLLLDLRALDKDPKTISVSETGQRVVCMTVQRKVKSAEAPARPSATATEDKGTREDADKKPSTRRLVVPSASSPMIKRTASSSSLSKGKQSNPPPVSPVRSKPISSKVSSRLPASPSAPAVVSPRPMRARTISSTNSASTLSSRVTSSSRTTATSRTSVSTSPPVRKVSGTRQALSPPKSPLSQSESGEDKLNVSIRVENLLGLPRRKGTTVEDEQMVSNTLSTASRVSTRQGVRSRTVSATSARTTSSRVASGSSLTTRTSATTKPPTNPLPSASSRRPSHTKTHSQASSVSIPRVNVSRTGSPVPRAEAVPVAFQDSEQLTAIRLAVSRTPSPDLPGPGTAGATPMPGAKRTKDKFKAKGKEKESALGVLGLGTPEVRRWVEAGEVDNFLDEHREGRRVGFLDPDPEDVNEVQIQSIEVVRSDKEQGARLEPGGSNGESEEATIKMTVQISPRRAPLGSTQLTPASSPLRHGGALPMPGLGAGLGQASSNPAHDLLHTLIRDALYDFRRETKAEIIGLHLDLVKMGRGWRKEMREALDQWSAELKEVRDENRKLREENEMLRRGY